MELIRLEDIHKTYHLGEVDVPVLCGISLTIRRGEMVALMGGRTVLSGMRASVAITATQLGLTLGRAETALDVDRAAKAFRCWCRLLPIRP